MENINYENFKKEVKDNYPIRKNLTLSELNIDFEDVDTRKKLYMVLDKTTGELSYNDKKYNELEKAIKIQKDMDNFQDENDTKLLELLQKSETSDKEIYSKVSLVKELTEEEKVDLVEEELEEFENDKLSEY